LTPDDERKERRVRLIAAATIVTQMAETAPQARGSVAPWVAAR